MHPTTPTRHHPVEPDPAPNAQDDAAPNPTQLPIEPEFGTMRPAGEADDPGAVQPPR